MNISQLYEKDFYQWTIETANLLRHKKFNELDVTHLLEEVESMGISEKRELRSRLEVLIAHLLKLQYQPNYINKNSWVRSVKEQRKRLLLLFKDMPSLRIKAHDEAENAYSFAVMKAADETGLIESTFPQQLPYTISQMLNEDFYPDNQQEV